MSKLVVVPLLLVISIPAGVSAQERVLRDKGVITAQPGVLAPTPEIQVIRGGEGGGAPDTGQPRPDPPPPKLTNLEKSALVVGLGPLDLSMGPWVVDIEKPSILPTASLAFWNPVMVDPGWGAAQLPGKPNARVVLRFRPPNPNRLYLVHCTGTEGGTYTVKPGLSQSELSFTNAPIQFVYDPAGDVDGESFGITRYTSGGFAWYFYGCEITAIG